MKIDLGQGPLPHAEGGFGTRRPARALARCTARRYRFDRRPRSPTARWRERFPLAMITPKTHLFLNSTFANQRAPALGAAGAVRRAQPGRRRRRAAIDDGGQRAGVQRPRLVPCAARVSDDARPGVVVAPMGWWNARLRRRRSAQATTSQALTELGAAPTFNDNRVEVEPAAECQVRLPDRRRLSAARRASRSSRATGSAAAPPPIPRIRSVTSTPSRPRRTSPASTAPTSARNWPRRLVLQRLGDDPALGRRVPGRHQQRREARAGRRDWVAADDRAAAPTTGYEAVEFDNLDSWTRFDGTPLADEVPFGKRAGARLRQAARRTAPTRSASRSAQKNTAEHHRKSSARAGRLRLRDRRGVRRATDECDRYRARLRQPRHRDRVLT